MVRVYWQTVMTTPSGYLTFLQNCTVGMLCKVYQKWYLIICYFCLYMDISCSQQWHNLHLLFHSQSIHITYIYFFYLLLWIQVVLNNETTDTYFSTAKIYIYIHIFFWFLMNKPLSRKSIFSSGGKKKIIVY